MTDVMVKILAVLGSGAGGGLGLGLLAQLFLRAMTARQPPRWSVQVVRLLGGTICAWLAALWLFSDGGTGVGGTGGVEFGTGVAQEDGEKTFVVSKKNGSTMETPAGPTLRIEVLGRAALSETDARAERWFRIETADGPMLMTLAQIKETIHKRRQGQPPLSRIEIVLYKDSPDERVPLVSRLRTWVADQGGGKMKVDLLRPDNQAPRK